LFLIFVFSRLKHTKKQKEIIADKKDEVDKAFGLLGVKNKEILDSINYAKRIQSAILPSKTLIDESFSQSFIIYLPKDIVAGDFYWLEKINNSVLFAVADCTGHGVPGAMVSVICNGGLNRSVREYGLTEPGEILDQTRQIVISEFEKSEEEVKDGMDIALCSLENNILKYAGAHNPLWIIKKGDSEVIEIKADKQPIGKFSNIASFTTHTLELEKGDSIYIFSDGFADQFGGIKGKKFKSNKLKDVLISIQDKTIAEQKKILGDTFENWKGDLEQLDDVCIMCVRV
jgi:serine phosphatase RsbU (regulator of sigma subunit)